MRRRSLLTNKKWFYQKFEYTGEVQSVVLHKGKYKLQCWGAQGGNVIGSYSAQGSKGGYSEGILTLNKKTTVYVFVGGKGADISTSNTSGTANGGWNGGGGSTRYSRYNTDGYNGYSYPRSGGGATDIALVTSTMSYNNYVTDRSNESLLSRFIVAGGGAGSSYMAYSKNTTTWGDSVTKNSFFYGKGSAGFYFSTDFSVTSGYNKCKGISYSQPSTTGVDRYSFRFLDSSGNNSGSSITNVTIGNTYDVPSGTTTIRFSVYTNSETSEGFSSTAASATLQIGKNSTGSGSGSSNASQQGGGVSGKGGAPGTQSGGGGSFGKGKIQTTTNYRFVSGAGGGGWYGGGSSYSDSYTSQINNSGGGSGFVNTAANASSRPSGYTGLQLDSGSTNDGATSFPATNGGTEVGHSGDGCAKITELDKNGNIPSRPIKYYCNWESQIGVWDESNNSDAVDGKMFTSQSMSDNGSTVIRCTFGGLSIITFRCRYQGENNYDYLTVGNLDSSCTRSSYKTSLKGSSGTWKDLTYSVSDNEQHYVEFCYSKDGSSTVSPDNANVLILAVE